MKSESETKSLRFLQISVWLLQAHRLLQTWWLLVHSKVTLIQRFWLDEISHYLYVHWMNRNRIHVILFKTITVFCIVQYKFLWTLEINIPHSLKALVNIVFKVHKNLYWPQQKTNCIESVSVRWSKEKCSNLYWRTSLTSDPICLFFTTKLFTQLYVYVVCLLSYMCTLTLIYEPQPPFLVKWGGCASVSKQTTYTYNWVNRQRTHITVWTALL
jgi:hypothetical protein